MSDDVVTRTSINSFKKKLDYFVQKRGLYRSKTGDETTELHNTVN